MEFRGKNVHVDDKGKEYVYVSNPNNELGIFSDDIIDAMGCVKSGNADTVLNLKMFGNSYFAIKYLDLEYGKMKRESALKEYSNLKPIYCVGYSPKNQLRSHTYLMGNREPITQYLGKAFKTSHKNRAEELVDHFRNTVKAELLEQVKDLKHAEHHVENKLDTYEFKVKQYLIHKYLWLDTSKLYKLANAYYNTLDSKLTDIAKQWKTVSWLEDLYSNMGMNLEVEDGRLMFKTSNFKVIRLTDDILLEYPLPEHSILFITHFIEEHKITL